MLDMMHTIVGMGWDESVPDITFDYRALTEDSQLRVHGILRVLCIESGLWEVFERAGRIS